jgi:hypothetical protein
LYTSNGGLDLQGLYQESGSNHHIQKKSTEVTFNFKCNT